VPACLLRWVNGSSDEWPLASCLPSTSRPNVRFRQCHERHQRRRLTVAGCTRNNVVTQDSPILTLHGCIGVLRHNVSRAACDRQTDRQTDRHNSATCIIDTLLTPLTCRLVNLLYVAQLSAVSSRRVSNNVTVHNTFTPFYVRSPSVRLSVCHVPTVNSKTEKNIQRSNMDES